MIEKFVTKMTVTYCVILLWLSEENRNTENKLVAL